MDREYAEYLLKKTKEDYNLIAEEFSSSRYSAWSELNLFSKYINEGDKVLDLGCGNGRLLELFKTKDIIYTGVDNSEKLIEIAKKRNPEADFFVTESLNLPFQDNYFDKIFCIAVLHHIPSVDFRRQFIKEAKRVLRPGGIFVITVWNLWPKFDSFKKIIKFSILKILGKTKLDFKDIFVPWQNKVDRYIHCFTKRELDKLIREVGFRVKEEGIFKRKETKNYNIYLVAEK
jgi:ubiquinone/menaquinone biosynthesis C-methylase UbiE